MEQQKEIQRLFRQQQEKYVYYVIALCVAAIAFAIHLTVGRQLAWTLVPLGIAVLFWAISVFCGLKFIAYTISTLYANNEYFEVLAGRNIKAGTDPVLIKAAARGIKEAMKLNSDTVEKFHKWQHKGFYLGSIAFILWHIIEMGCASALN